MGVWRRVARSRRAMLRRLTVLPAVITWTLGWLLWSDGAVAAAIACVAVALALTALPVTAFRASLRDETEPPVYPPPY